MASALDAVINRCYMDGVAVQATYARTNAALMAAAASLGFITTLTHDGSYGRTWRPTHEGYLWVKEGAYRG